ncbi:MAG: hypothetical protein M3N49_06105 [Candidatus Eremiobacteraeota bacterium]|nr:hypothetical protein [Candidatus Eremiobacteraeota bacterium]
MIRAFRVSGYEIAPFFSCMSLLPMQIPNTSRFTKSSTSRLLVHNR